MAKWGIYHKIKQKRKRYFLSKLRDSDGFNILKELHEFAYRTGNRTNIKELDIAKIKLLTKVHSMFTKVKCKKGC